MRWTAKSRRGVLIVISVLCLGAGAAILYGQRDLTRADRPRTSVVTLLLGLTLLPGATFAARRLERRLKRSAWDRAAA